MSGRAGGRRGAFSVVCVGKPFRGIECSADSRHPRPAPGARMPHALAVAPDLAALLADGAWPSRRRAGYGPQLVENRQDARCLPRIGDHAVESPATQLVNLRKTYPNDSGSLSRALHRRLAIESLAERGSFLTFFSCKPVDLTNAKSTLTIG
jgi:hypothetical protein